MRSMRNPGQGSSATESCERITQKLKETAVRMLQHRSTDLTHVGEKQKILMSLLNRQGQLQSSLSTASQRRAELEVAIGHETSALDVIQKQVATVDRECSLLAHRTASAREAADVTRRVLRLSSEVTDRGDPAITAALAPMALPHLRREHEKILERSAASQCDVTYVTETGKMPDTNRSIDWACIGVRLPPTDISHTACHTHALLLSTVASLDVKRDTVFHTTESLSLRLARCKSRLEVASPTVEQWEASQRLVSTKDMLLREIEGRHMELSTLQSKHESVCCVLQQIEASTEEERVAVTALEKRLRELEQADAQLSHMITLCQAETENIREKVSEQEKQVEEHKARKENLLLRNAALRHQCGSLQSDMEGAHTLSKNVEDSHHTLLLRSNEVTSECDRLEKRKLGLDEQHDELTSHIRHFTSAVLSRDIQRIVMAFVPTGTDDAPVSTPTQSLVTQLKLNSEAYLRDLRHKMQQVEEGIQCSISRVMQYDVESDDDRVDVV